MPTDGNAENQVKAIDEVFTNKVIVPAEHHTKLQLSATADEAAVQTAAFHGLMTWIKEDDRPLFNSITCLNIMF